MAYVPFPQQNRGALLQPAMARPAAVLPAQRAVTGGGIVAPRVAAAPGAYAAPIQAFGAPGQARVLNAPSAGLLNPPAAARPRVLSAGQALPSAAMNPTASGGYGAMTPGSARQPGYAPTPQALAPGPSPMVGGNPIQTTQRLLSNRQELKNHIIDAFKKVAGGGKTVDIHGLRLMRSDLAQRLGLPEQIFGTIDDEYIRFDFDGSGFLVVNEVYKLIKWHLYEYLQEAGAVSSKPIPTKTLAQAGFTILKELGGGNQAVAKLAVDQYGNQRCVKQFNKGQMFNYHSLADLQDEFETMQLLACKNIARSFDIFQDNSSVYLITEVYHGGDFTSLKQNAMQKIGGTSEDWWRGIFRQCFEALDFMHKQAMMHCDIKEPNLMLRSDNYSSPQVVLIDFGVSKAMTARDTGMVSGTPGYMPPETMNSGKWYPSGDVFSMGVVIYQMLTGCVPDEAAAKAGAPPIGLFLTGCNSLEDVKYQVNTRQPNYNAMPPNMPGIKNLTMRLLDKNLRSRPKAPTALKDPWFGSLPSMMGNTPVEMAMMPDHPMATVGITDEMLAGADSGGGVPAMAGINAYGAVPMPVGRVI